MCIDENADIRHSSLQNATNVAAGLGHERNVVVNEESRPRYLLQVLLGQAVCLHGLALADINVSNRLAVVTSALPLMDEPVACPKVSIPNLGFTLAAHHTELK
jgi:hypothetical protein